MNDYSTAHAQWLKGRIEVTHSVIVTPGNKYLVLPGDYTGTNGDGVQRFACASTHTDGKAAYQAAARYRAADNDEGGNE